MSKSLMAMPKKPDPWVPVLLTIQKYLAEHASGERDCFYTNETEYGLFIGLGDSAFLLSSYSEEWIVEPGNSARMYSLNQLKESFT